MLQGVLWLIPFTGPQIWVLISTPDPVKHPTEGKGEGQKPYGAFSSVSFAGGNQASVPCNLQAPLPHRPTLPTCPPGVKGRELFATQHLQMRGQPGCPHVPQSTDGRARTAADLVGDHVDTVATSQCAPSAASTVRKRRIGRVLEEEWSRFTKALVRKVLQRFARRRKPHTKSRQIGVA